jgi:hypothetical protein
MLKSKAKLLARDAIAYTEGSNPQILEWARGVGPHTFKRMRMRGLLEVYCRVVYASGFRYKTVKARFPAISEAFHNFDPIRLARMRSTARALKAFGSRRKAANFLLGAKSILREGLPAFKRRVQANALCTLDQLPGIGPITRYHFAKDIGILDTAKPDIWLKRAAKLCNAKTVEEMINYQSKVLGESQHTIDVAVWTYAEAGCLPRWAA